MKIKRSDPSVLLYCLVFILLLSCSKQEVSVDNVSLKTSTTASTNGMIDGNGGRYDLSSSADRIVPFDFYGDGTANELILYRPGNKVCWMMKNNASAGSNPSYSSVFKSSNGIPCTNGTSYDLSSPNDKILPFDLAGTGIENYFICYRPGNKVCWVMRSNGNGNFTRVFQSTNGIGGYDLSSPLDRIVPYDYYDDGTANELICYRPGNKIFWILSCSVTNDVASFSAIYTSANGTASGGGYHSYDLSSTADIIITLNPFPFVGYKNRHYFLCYRPGNYLAWIMEPFFPDYQSLPHNVFTPGGLGDFDLSNSNDRVIPFDYSNIGYPNEMLCYRPGGGICYIETNTTLPSAGINISSSFRSTNGIGTGSDRYDLSSTNDQIVALDLDGVGKVTSLICYRPGAGVIYIFRNNGGSFVKVY